MPDQKMQKIVSVDTSKITLVKNKFQPEGTILYDLKYDNKPMTVYSFGLIDSPALKSTNFGEKYSFKFKPPAEDYVGLGDLDVLDYCELIGLDDAEIYERRSFLENGYIMNIKLNQRKTGGFVTATNVGLTVDNLGEFLVPGKPVTIIGSLSLYVREATATEKGQYGLYFTLTDLQFEKPEAVPLKKATIRKTK